MDLSTFCTKNFRLLKNDLDTMKHQPTSALLSLAEFGPDHQQNSWKLA